MVGHRGFINLPYKFLEIRQTSGDINGIINRRHISFIKKITKKLDLRDIEHHQNVTSIDYIENVTDFYRLYNISCIQNVTSSLTIYRHSWLAALFLLTLPINS
jgi:hypothetical protein